MKYLHSLTLYNVQNIFFYNINFSTTFLTPLKKSGCALKLNNYNLLILLCFTSLQLVIWLHNQQIFHTKIVGKLFLKSKHHSTFCCCCITIIPIKKSHFYLFLIRKKMSQMCQRTAPHGKAPPQATNAFRVRIETKSSKFYRNRKKMEKF